MPEVLAIALAALSAAIIFGAGNRLLALLTLFVLLAMPLAGCAEQYRTAQLPACTQHCTFTDGGREVSVSK